MKMPDKKLSRLNFPAHLTLVIKSFLDSEYEQDMEFLQGRIKATCQRNIGSHST